MLTPATIAALSIAAFLSTLLIAIVLFHVFTMCRLHNRRLSQYSTFRAQPDHQNRPFQYDEESGPSTRPIAHEQAQYNEQTPIMQASKQGLKIDTSVGQGKRHVEGTGQERCQITPHKKMKEVWHHLWQDEQFYVSIGWCGQVSGQQLLCPQHLLQMTGDYKRECAGRAERDEGWNGGEHVSTFLIRKMIFSPP
jgi:hypothetical protein